MYRPLTQQAGISPLAAGMAADEDEGHCACAATMAAKPRTPTTLLDIFVTSGYTVELRDKRMWVGKTNERQKIHARACGTLKRKVGKRNELSIDPEEIEGHHGYTDLDGIGVPS